MPPCPLTPLLFAWTELRVNWVSSPGICPHLSTTLLWIPLFSLQKPVPDPYPGAFSPPKPPAPSSPGGGSRCRCPRPARRERSGLGTRGRAAAPGRPARRPAPSAAAASPPPITGAANYGAASRESGPEVRGSRRRG